MFYFSGLLFITWGSVYYLQLSEMLMTILFARIPSLVLFTFDIAIVNSPLDLIVTIPVKTREMQRFKTILMQLTIRI